MKAKTPAPKEVKFTIPTIQTKIVRHAKKKEKATFFKEKNKPI